jgi:hypothetical protein
MEFSGLIHLNNPLRIKYERNTSQLMTFFKVWPWGTQCTVQQCSPGIFNEAEFCIFGTGIWTGHMFEKYNRMTE